MCFVIQLMKDAHKNISIASSNVWILQNFEHICTSISRVLPCHKFGIHVLYMRRNTKGGVRKLILIVINSGAENLKKSRQKNSWNQINLFFLREIAFLAVLTFFPSSKIHFCPFLKLQKNGIWSKIIFLKLVYLISLDFF